VWWIKILDWLKVQSIAVIAAVIAVGSVALRLFWLKSQRDRATDQRRETQHGSRRDGFDNDW